MKTQQSKRGTRANAKPADPVVNALEACAQAQDRLTRHTEQSKKIQDARRDAVRAAFNVGATTKEIAQAVQVSRTQIYQLLGSARALKR